MNQLDPVLDTLQQQVECYRRLLALAGTQHDCVQQMRTDELLDVLGQRQALLDQLAGLEQTLAPARRDWTKTLGRLSDDLRGKAQSLLEETRRMLQQITAADRSDSLALHQSRLNLCRQLSKARLARQTRGSYAGGAGGRPGPAMDVQR